MKLSESYSVERFDWRVWGDETVVFVESTASTHLFSAEAAASLRALIDAFTVDARLRADRIPDTAMLAEFERIGLVSLAPS